MPATPRMMSVKLTLGRSPRSRHRVRRGLPHRFRDYPTSFTDIEPADWLTFPEQKLRPISTGPVFHDEVGLAYHCRGQGR